jgi:hypothetical protein
MNLFTAMFSLLRRANGRIGTAPDAMATKVHAAVVLVPPEPEPRQKTTKPAVKVHAIEGRCGYNAFRRFLFKSTYPQAGPELIENPRILIERDMNPGQVYVEADGKEILLEAEDGIRIVSVKHVLGIIYHSRSGNTELRWRDDKPRGRVWGHVTRRSLGLLLSRNVHIKSISAPASS